MEMKDLFEGIGVAMKEGGYKHLKFEWRISPKDSITPIDIMDFSTRTENALKSAGIFTMKDLADRVTNSSDLKPLHNMGAKSVKEVMNALLYTHIERNVLNKRKPYEGITFC